VLFKQALSLAEAALSLSKQATAITSLSYLLLGYAILLRVHLSLGSLDMACSLLQQLKAIGIRLNQPFYIDAYSHFTTVDHGWPVESWTMPHVGPKSWM
jgi:hypothetical protein